MIKINNLHLWIIVLSGIILRFCFISEQSLWMDEASVFNESWQRTFAQTWSLRHALQPQNAPLYPLLLVLFQKLIPINFFISFRFLSAVFGGLTLIVLKKISEEYFTEKKQQFCFLLIMAFWSFHIQYSQLIRFYSLLVFVFYLHFYLSLRWFKTGERKWLVFLIFSASIGCWSNQLFILSFLMISLYSIFHHGINWRKIFIFNTINIFGFITYIPSYLIYTRGGFKIGSFRPIGYKDFLFMLKSVFLPKHLGPSLLELRYHFFNKFPISQFINEISPIVILETIITICYAAILIYLLLNFKKLTKDIFIPIGILGLFLSYLFFKNVPLNDRYFLIFIPIIYLWIIKSVFLTNKKYQILILFFLIFINLWSTGNYFFNKRHHVINMDKILQSIPKSTILLSFDSATFFINYFKNLYPDKTIGLVENLAPREVLELKAKEYFSAIPDFYFIYTHRSLLKLESVKNIIESMKKTHYLDDKTDSDAIYYKIYHFKKKE